MNHTYCSIQKSNILREGDVNGCWVVVFYENNVRYVLVCKPVQQHEKDEDGYYLSDSFSNESGIYWDVGELV